MHILSEDLLCCGWGGCVYSVLRVTVYADKRKGNHCVCVPFLISLGTYFQRRVV